MRLWKTADLRNLRTASNLQCGPLRQQGIAVGNNGLPDNGRWRTGGRRGRKVQPQPGFQMQCGARHGVAHLLQIMQSEEFNVALSRTTIGDRPPDWKETKTFLRGIDLQSECVSSLFVGK